MIKRISLLTLIALLMQLIALAQEDRYELKNASFTVATNKYGIGDLFKTNDVHSTNYVRKGGVFGDVVVRYAIGRKFDSVRTSASGQSFFILEGKTIGKYQPANFNNNSLLVTQTFSLLKDSLTWNIQLHNASATPIRVEDLAVPLAYNAGGGENPTEIFEQRVIKHHFISGNNSFLFWQRPTGLAPYLVMVPQEGTSLEYFSTAVGSSVERGVFQAYIHSTYTGNKELRGTWRQPHTFTYINPGENKNYAFKMRWAASYQNLRDILLQEGLVDVQVMPGMTVPSDMEARVALRTKQKINSIDAEFGSRTTIKYLGEHGKENHLYSIRFSRLGENKLVVNFGKNYKTYLEFFVTEPLETLYKKRAAFITHHQQHRVPGKWYDGLFGVYDMKNASLRGPDNPDYFDTSRLSYVLTCDDPGLCKAPFVASKNVVYPDKQEIDALEYYIKNFVWGGLQRTDKETPYSYGVYGTPSWYVNRDTSRRRRNIADRNQERMHVWRSYDYPHIIMLYWHMYQLATLYPNLTHYLDAKGYLERSKETAKAYFKYPYEILPWYETFKWGCYNELILPDIITELKRKGYADDAAFLTAEWEKKVKYFVYDDPYPFRSEYAIDATAFESSHALAKYAVVNIMQPDSNLWYDKNLKKWYSHPQIKKQDAVQFMDRQIQANMALRGVVEPAYYYLGSDFRGRSDSYTLSYMSQMGGWSILDYGLHFAPDPADYIRLGYQAYLSSFALINSGIAESNYGFWYPGKENDGASGWAFEPQKYATPWIQKPQGRGPWFYDGEIDLGFGGALRSAATVVTNDPVFGMVAYGGDLKESNNILHVVPKDGLRRRFFYRNGDCKIDVELNRDGFAGNKTISLELCGKSIQLMLENRSADKHNTEVSIKGLTGRYEVKTRGKVQVLNMLADGSIVTIPVLQANETTVSFRKIL